MSNTLYTVNLSDRMKLNCKLQIWNFILHCHLYETT